MQEKLLNWAHAIFVLAGSGAVFFLTMLGLYKFSEPYVWSGSAAGWTQAIGSILSVWVAFAIASHQQRIAAEREKAAVAQREAEKNAAVCEVIAHGCALVIGIPGRGKDRETFDMHRQIVPRSAFQNIRDALSRAPVYELREKQVVAQLLAALDMTDRTIALLGRIDEMPSHERIAHWPGLAGSIEKERSAARGILENLKTVQQR